MLDKEVYFTKGRWWFAIVERGRFGQVMNTVINPRRCRSRWEARQQSRLALEYMKANHDAA